MRQAVGYIRRQISIHAPRTGSDADCQQPNAVNSYFNPRSPHGERLRGIVRSTVDSNFNPRSPHGERPPVSVIRGEHNNFNPRSPHGERLRSCFAGVKMIAFQSTLPARGATGIYRGFISGIIHFNPRSPHGERPRGTFAADFFIKFQSTLPARGATIVLHKLSKLGTISIHAPRTGSDLSGAIVKILLVISIHAPRTGSDRENLRRCLYPPISIHAPRTGSDNNILPISSLCQLFQSTLPARGATGFAIKTVVG